MHDALARRPRHVNATADPTRASAPLRLEDGAGCALDVTANLALHWHRPPYAMALRVVRDAAEGTGPEILDEAVIGTRGSRAELLERIEAVGARLLRDAAAGVGRGMAVSLPPLPRRMAFGGILARLDRAAEVWRQRLTSEWWSVGSSSMPLADVVLGGRLAQVRWLQPELGKAYLADPFPWPGTGNLLCEEMPMAGGRGRIVALRPGAAGRLEVGSVVLEDAGHHSYPCAFRDGDVTYLLPEAPDRGQTTLYRLGANGQLAPVCHIAPGLRLADPTLFRHAGRYWIACTDLDIGEHDNLCLLHAERLTGPWQPHRCTPARIDIRGARPAGPVFRLGEGLFRPGQDCARTYGAAVVIHQIEELTPETYRETQVSVLRPDPRGPFPHGLHTFAVGEDRLWIDGKRFVLDLRSLMRKLAARLGRRRAVAAGNPAC
jgi:hypothetical protein